MSLHRRLTLFFILIVILPLAAAGYIVQRVAVSEASRRAELGLRPVINSATVRYNDRSQMLDGLVRGGVGESPRFAGALARGRRTEVEEHLRAGLETTPGLGFLIALDENGEVIGSAFNDPSFASGVANPSAEEIVKARGSEPGFVRGDPIEVRLQGRGTVGEIVGGYWLDDSILQGTTEGDIDAFIVNDGRVIAGTREVDSGVDADLTSAEALEVELDGDSGEARATPLGGGNHVMAWTPRSQIDAVSRQVLGSMIALLAVALAATALLAYLLARVMTGPLEELADGARAIAKGHFHHRIPVRSRDEVGGVAVAFNEMTERLSTTIQDLASSRDQLQRAVERVGETLRSTHDMKQILESLLNTAADALVADAACLWIFTSARNELYCALALGMEAGDLPRMRVGNGIVGLVAERGVTVMLPAEGRGPRPGSGEPEYPVAISIPLYSADRIMGVLSVYRDSAERQFTLKDLDTVVFLAEQGGVAIENVLLHEEAQRLSLTDGLTGVWNRRYLQMQFRQVLASATRFERPFSVLMLDLDHFKAINDTHGHTRGDAILIEFTKRVSSALREIDTFARYGGEEFCCLLNETDVEGASITAEKIREEIESERFGGAGEEPIELTVSIGVATFPQHGIQWQSLIEAADQALYQAKQQGRNRVVVARTPPKGGLQIAR